MRKERETLSDAMGALNIDILPQPDDTSCGPTCLLAVYRYFGDDIEFSRVISEVKMLEGGGTLAVFLANHALKRGFDAKIYSYNLQLFDPTWAGLSVAELKRKLILQMEHKHDAKLALSTRAYLEFFDLGGSLHFEDLSASLIRKFLKKPVPVITALSATYLYKSSREYGPQSEYDDVRGDPAGHFVVLAGYDEHHRTVTVADPLLTNPIAHTHTYDVSIERLIGAIFLGILTYDAKLLILQPREKSSGNRE
ncbi:MAG: C39 family peptidase [Desulfomonilia bacterium]